MLSIYKKTIILLFLPLLLFASRVKTPSDVYSYAITLKKKVEYLRIASNIKTPFPTVQQQKDKYPRHVLQKSLEILSKINLYRIAKGYGEIFIPPYPTRNVTPSDVYDSVKRLDEEVTPFIKNKKFLKSIKIKYYTKKTPNDVYQLLWSISLAFDSLLGIHGYTPTEVYALSEKLVDTVKFIRESQNIYNKVEKPKKISGLHPNHALYKSYDFLTKISNAEKKLWINSSAIPKKPHRVITPTDVYDSIQYDLTELQRIKYRLGLERYFKLKKIKKSKTPSDVVQNISYAIDLMPEFSLKKELIQYPQKSLAKTPNDVFGATQEIIEKLQILKSLRGISQKAKEPPFIYQLKPIHAYQKAIEATEKSIKLKTQMGFYPSQIPSSPLRKITPNEVYEIVLRLDGITTILLKKAGYTKTNEYIYKIDKKIYTDKTPSDVYNNLWKISNTLDLLLAKEYTPNETFYMIKNIKNKTLYISKRIGIKKTVFDTNQISLTSKNPKDVFYLSLQIFELIKKIQSRLNMGTTNIIIPKEKNITPNTVYNSLRIINAGLNEILIYLNVEEKDIEKYNNIPEGKTPTDVYKEALKVKNILTSLFEDENYAK